MPKTACRKARLARQATQVQTFIAESKCWASCSGIVCEDSSISSSAVACGGWSARLSLEVMDELAFNVLPPCYSCRYLHTWLYCHLCFMIFLKEHCHDICAIPLCYVLSWTSFIRSSGSLICNIAILLAIEVQRPNLSLQHLRSYPISGIMTAKWWTSGQQA